MDIAFLGVGVDTSRVRRGAGDLREFDTQAARTQRSTMSLTGALSGLAKVAGAAIVASIGTKAVQSFASYEQGLRNVAAVSGATATELADLDAAALRAAASTRFNPAQTTSALYSLASAGQSAAEQIASLPNVLNLAEAAQADLSQTTELMTSTLSQFGIDASQSARVADVFAASIGASALNVGRLQVAFRNAGPTAAALNQSLEGTTAVIGLLTSAFGNGERAGTGFRALLNELPQKAKDLGLNLYDANGAMRPFVDLLADMEASGLTGAAAVRTFGAEAGPALAALLGEGADALRDMESKIGSTGQAAAVAAEQLDTLQGDIDNLKSAIDVALVEIGRSQSNFARPAIQAITNLIRLWSGYGDTLGDALVPTQRISDAVETLAKSVLGLSILWAGQYVSSVGLAAVATGTLAGAMKILRLAIAGTGIGALALIITDVIFKIYDAATQTEEFAGAIEGVMRPAGDLFNFLKTGAEATGATFDALTANISAAFVGAFATIYTAYADVTNAMLAGLRLLGVQVNDMDRDWATGLYNTLAADAKASGERAGQLWAKAFGARVPEVFDVGATFGNLSGSNSYDSVDDMWAALRRGGPVLAEVATSTTSLSDGLSAANDNTIDLTKGIRSTTGALSEMEQFSRSVTSTLASGFSDVFKAVVTGSGNAMDAVGRLVSRLGDMFLNQSFQMLFGGFNPLGFVFGGGMNFSPGVGPLATGLFASGGYTGNAPTNMPTGIVHGQEFVMSAAATRRIGRPALEAMNDGRTPANQNGGGISLTMHNTIQVPPGATEAEGAAFARAFAKELKVQLPDALQKVERNPLRRHG